LFVCISVRIHLTGSDGNSSPSEFISCNASQWMRGSGMPEVEQPMSAACEAVARPFAPRPGSKSCRVRGPAPPPHCLAPDLPPPRSPETGA
jgi:hypothetical protein